METALISFISVQVTVQKKLLCVSLGRLSSLSRMLAFTCPPRNILLLQNKFQFTSSRGLCDAVYKVGSILHVPITKELRTSVSAARHRYEAYLESQKEQLEGSTAEKAHCRGGGSKHVEKEGEACVNGSSSNVLSRHLC